jgi:hypothetical protein
VRCRAVRCNEVQRGCQGMPYLHSGGLQLKYTGDARDECQCSGGDTRVAGPGLVCSSQGLHQLRNA